MALLFSLILPVYKVELYIEKCLRSCLDRSDLFLSREIAVETKQFFLAAVLILLRKQFPLIGSHSQSRRTQRDGRAGFIQKEI